MSWCLCCAEAEEEEEVDRVELAFQRMDINRDGHVTYAEFRKVTAALEIKGVNEFRGNFFTIFREGAFSLLKLGHLSRNIFL